MGHVDVLVLGDRLDSVHVVLLFKDEALVGSTMEAVENELSEVGHILGDVEAFQVVTVDGVDDVVLVGSEVAERLTSSPHSTFVLCLRLLSFRFDWLELGPSFFDFLDDFESPELISSFMESILQDLCSFFRFSSSDIKSFVF